jgi:predicted methyltransferase MtxX (methanogen marker protein 4)
MLWLPDEGCPLILRQEERAVFVARCSRLKRISLDLGIVDFPSRESAVFNALTHGHAETGVHGASSKPTSVVKVHDERLEKLGAHFRSKY